MLGDLLTGLGEGLLEVGKTAAPLLVSGAIMKHGGKLTSWVPRGMIPVANGVIGTAIGVVVTGDPEQGAQYGILAATTATGLHQVLKIGARAGLERVLPARVQERVGPGDRLSI